MRPRITYANVMATVAVFIALGGTTYAATQLGKNTVGSKQLKKNAVVTAKVKNGAITAKKLKKGALEGAQVTGTVPSAQTANTLAPPEAWHLVGAPGEPPFSDGSGVQVKNAAIQGAESVAFYMDKEGVVHLRGQLEGPAEGFAFFLPPGFRPADGKIIPFTTFCETCTPLVAFVSVYGTTSEHLGPTNYSGGVYAGGEEVSLDGMDFRAEG